MATSSEPLASQMPLNTQLSYSRSLSISQDSPHVLPRPRLQTSSRHASPSGVRAQQQQNVQSSPYPQGTPPKHGQIQDAQRAQSVEKVDAYERAAHIRSSNESIECLPCNAPVPEPTPAEELESPDFLDHQPVSQRPFPLVEWIKAIRRDTPGKWPLSSLRWASAIPKRQQAILDSDETWLPPLAGKPARPGTVPVDLLQHLSNRADRHAEARARQAKEDTNRIDIELAQLEEGPLSDADCSPTAKSHRTQRDPTQDEEEEEDVPWSSSPPDQRNPRKRDLPPDTSPVRPVVQAHHGTRKTVDQRLQTLLEADSPVKDTSEEQMTDAGMPHSQLEPGHAESLGRQRSPTLPDVSVPDQSQPLAFPEPKTIRAKLIAKVQVKETPYIIKEVQKSLPVMQPSHEDLPASSFVGATYPDPHPTMPRARHHKILREDANSPMQEEASHTPMDDVQSLTVQNIPRKQKRSLQFEDNPISPDARLPEDLEQEARAPTPHPLTASRRPETDGALEDLHGLPSKRQKVHHPRRPGSIVSNKSYHYESHDNKRMLERRSFMRSISTTWKNAGPEDPSAFLRHHHTKIRTNSRASSVGSTRYSNAHDSEAHHTSATNISIHESTIPKTPARKPLSRSASLRETLPANSTDQLLAEFVNAYPKYAGNEKSFRSALRLLLELQSQPREPHPSMRDDFVYRMADDYKRYLQQCIMDDENALPYQEYYHSYVRRSAHTKEIITDGASEDISNVAKQPGHTAPLSARPSLVVVDNQRDNHSDVDMEDAQHDDEESVQIVDGPTIPETQAPPAATARLSPPLPMPTAPLSSQPVLRADGRLQSTITMSAAKKRRSLPWDAARNLASSHIPEIQLTPVGKPTSTRSTASSKVENWLLTSRIAGVASPELEPVQLTPRDKDRPNEHVMADNDVTDLTLEQSKQPSSPLRYGLIAPLLAHKPMPISRSAARPSSKFSLFASNYEKLYGLSPKQTLTPAEDQRTPINIFNW